MLPHDFLSSPMPTCTPLNMGHPPRSAASEASASTLAAAFDSPLPDSSQSAVRAAQRERSAQQFRPFRAAPPTDLYGAASRTAEQQASGGAQRSAPVECDDDDVEVDAKGTRKPRPEYYQNTRSGARTPWRTARCALRSSVCRTSASVSSRTARGAT